MNCHGHDTENDIRHTTKMSMACDLLFLSLFVLLGSGRLHGVFRDLFHDFFHLCIFLIFMDNGVALLDFMVWGEGHRLI